MKRHTSWKSLLWAMALAAIAILSAACARSPEAKSAKFMAEGKRLMEKNDPTRAILQFRNAVQSTPKDAEAYYQLGLAYIASGDVRSGVVGFRKALTLNPKHYNAQLRLAQLMTATNDKDTLKDAQQRLQGLVADSGNNAEALNALAFTELKLGEQDAGLEHLEAAFEAAPADVIFAATLAEAKLQTNDLKGAEEVLKKACENSPKTAGMWVALGRFYVSQKRVAEAEQQFQRAISLDPASGTAIADLAMLQNRLGRKQEAEQNFKHLSVLPSKTFQPYYALYLFQEGRRDEAVREFERLAKADPDDRLARTRLIKAYRSVNRAADAEKILDGALKKNPKDMDALLERSETLFSEGKYADAEAGLNQVLHLQADSGAAYYALAKLHQAQGLDLKYRQDLFKTVELNPRLLQVRLELAQSLITAKQVQSAMSLLDSTPPSQRQALSVLVLRNWAFWALGDLPQMRKGIDAGLAVVRSADLLLQDGLWKLRSGNFTAANAALEEALKIDPQDPRALGALARSYDTQKQGPIALQKAKEFAAHQPKSAPVQDFTGWILFSHGDRAEARAMFTAAKNADPHFTKADLSLIQIDVADRKYDDAENRLKQLVADNRVENTTAMTWLGNIELLKGNYSAALEEFRKVMEAGSNDPKILNDFAYLLAEYGNQPAEALKYAEKAVELAPEQSAYCDTLGWVLYQKGVYASAVKYLERATSKPKGDVVWQYHLAMAYAKAGETSRSRSTLDAALKVNPNVPAAKVAQQVVAMAK